MRPKKASFAVQSQGPASSRPPTRDHPGDPPFRSSHRFESQMLQFWLRAIAILALIANAQAFRISREKSNVVMRMYSTEGMSENNMTVDELKAELDLRKVNYDDCISKKELVSRLIQSRASGRASTDVFEQFAANEAEATEKGVNVSEVFDDDDLMEEAVSADGALPGGLPPEMMKALAADPEIMAYLKDPKFQDIMKAVMNGGPEALKKYLADPDALQMLQKLSTAMAKVTGQ